MDKHTWKGVPNRWFLQMSCSRQSHEAKVTSNHITSKLHRKQGSTSALLPFLYPVVQSWVACTAAKPD